MLVSIPASSQKFRSFTDIMLAIQTVLNIFVIFNTRTASIIARISARMKVHHCFLNISNANLYAYIPIQSKSIPKKPIAAKVKSKVKSEVKYKSKKRETKIYDVFLLHTLAPPYNCDLDNQTLSWVMSLFSMSNFGRDRREPSRLRCYHGRLLYLVSALYLV